MGRASGTKTIIERNRIICRPPPRASLCTTADGYGRSHRAGRRGRRPGVDQTLRRWLDAEVQSIERSRAEEHEVARLAEDDFVDRPDVADSEAHCARPSFQDGAVGLPEMPSL